MHLWKTHLQSTVARHGALMAVVFALSLAGCGRKPRSAADDGDQPDTPRTKWGNVPVLAPDFEPKTDETDGKAGGDTPDEKRGPEGDTTAPEAQPACNVRPAARPMRPVDILVAIGGYGSASREIPWISLNLSAIHAQLEAAGLAPRVILVGGPDLCVYPPLGDGECGETADYRHLPLWIEPQKLLDVLEETTADYHASLRPDSKRALIWLSDAWPLQPEDPEEPAPDPQSGALRLRQLLGTELLVSTLVSQLDPDVGPCWANDSDFVRPLPAQIAQQVGGQAEVVCGRQKSHIDQIFTAATELIEASAELGCRLELPSAKPFDASRDQLWVNDAAGSWRSLSRAQDANACDVDSYKLDGRALVLCPALCRASAAGHWQFEVRSRCPSNRLH
jgi:hypothetical protein